MISFTYHEEYNSTSNGLKKKAEELICNYISDKFNSYSELDIKIKLLPKYAMDAPTCVVIPTAIAVINENTIKFNFDRFCDYLILLKKRKGNLLIPDIRKDHCSIFNSLHHEMQHIVNHIKYKDMFDYIKDMRITGYEKVGISNLIDEYLASYSAQSEIFSQSGTVNGGLAAYCKNKDLVIMSNDGNQKIDLYLNILDLLAYAVGECKVLSEKKDRNNDFDNILCKESISRFAEVFINIKELLENYSYEHYKEYVQACEIELKKFISILRIDLEDFKLIDSYIDSHNKSSDLEIKK